MIPSILDMLKIQLFYVNFFALMVLGIVNATLIFFDVANSASWSLSGLAIVILTVIYGVVWVLNALFGDESGV